jgi:hypothetical protein
VWRWNIVPIFGMRLVSVLFAAVKQQPLPGRQTMPCITFLTDFFVADRRHTRPRRQRIARADASTACLLSDLSLACVANPIMIAGFARKRLRFRARSDALAMRDINKRQYRAS